MSRPKSAYVHVPFCRNRCGYCNFTLITGRDDLIASYLDALELEMEAVLGLPSPMDTIFLGGGTPSYLPANDLNRLLEIVAAWLPLRANHEFSCEMNPLDVSDDHLRLLKEHGVNRVSLGGQSFCDKKLRLLERDHSGQQLRTALDACFQQIDNVSLDLIFATPHETRQQWHRDVELALQSPIRHLSTYGLTIERGAAFYGRTLRNELEELDSDLQLDMYEHAIDSLTQAGWEHYEVSSFAHGESRCRHNEAYWLGQPWWAFGPGAASFLPLEDDSGAYVRSVNHRSTTSYIARQLSGRTPIAETDVVSPEQQIRERLVFGLRRLAGVSLQELSRHFGSPARALFEPYLTRYVEQGWISIDSQEHVRLTRSGLVISDSLWPDLL